MSRGTTYLANLRLSMSNGLATFSGTNKNNLRYHLESARIMWAQGEHHQALIQLQQHVPYPDTCPENGFVDCTPYHK